MKELNLKLAQQDIDEALQAVEDMEQYIDNSDASKEVLKEKFLTLSQKLQQLENILKTEGIIE